LSYYGKAQKSPNRNNQKEKSPNGFRNIERKNSNYSANKIYLKDKNKDQTLSLEDKGINSFEKLDAFVEENINSLTIDKEFTCNFFEAQNFYFFIFKDNKYKTN